MLSVILYGRNDSHGYNLHKRAALSFNCIAEVLTHDDDEIVFVDYNTPDDYPTFVEAVQDTLTDRAKRLLRVLRVRPEQHDRFRTRSHLFALEPVARNIAVRRCNPANRWILSTNTDMIFVPRRPGTSLSDVVAAAADGFYELPRFELPECLWESLDRRDPADVIRRVGDWGVRLHLNEVVYGNPYILYDGPGDFQLMLRSDIFAVHGFHEQMLLGWHVDSNLCKRMVLLRGRVGSLLDEVFGYHCDHTRQATVVHKPGGLSNDTRTYFEQVDRPDLPDQADSWGMPDEPIEEFRPAGSPTGRYLRSLEATLPGADRPFTETHYTEQSFNRHAADPRHVLSYLADQLSSLPPAIGLGYVGCNGPLLKLLVQVWREMGRNGRVLVLSPQPERLGESSEWAPAADLSDLHQQAGAFVFDFSRDRPMGRVAELIEPEPGEMELLGRVQNLLEQAAELERRALRKGGPLRKFIAVDCIHTNFEAAVSRELNVTLTPFSSRVRHGYVRTEGTGGRSYEDRLIALMGERIEDKNGRIAELVDQVAHLRAQYADVLRLVHEKEAEAAVLRDRVRELQGSRWRKIGQALRLAGKADWEKTVR
jgi:hypothetical protein